jgi:branched-chain amino acid transport system substrate-binding protein
MKEALSMAQTQPKAPHPLPQFMRKHRPLIIVGLPILVFVVVFLGVSSCVLSSQARTPLKLAMVTTATSSTPSQEEAREGLESLRSVQLYIQTVNQAGGVNGHPLQLQIFDDKYNPKTARQVAQQIVDSPSLLVLGPVYSRMVPHDPPIYKDAIPLLTGTVSADRLTRENSSAFRLRTNITSQGNMSATYARQILGSSTATIVYTNDPDYGRPTAEAFKKPFAEQGGKISPQDLPLPLNFTPSELDALVSTLAHDPNPGIIYVAALEGPTRDVIVALRRHGIKAPIFCTTASGHNYFAKYFASHLNDYPEERQQPGYFTDGVYAPAPVIFDSAPDQAQTFATQYRDMYGEEPGWFGAMFYESAQVAVAALEAANVQGTPASLKSDRERIANRLAAMNSPQTSVEGINGPVYFDRDHNAVLPLRFGQFLHRRLRSRPIQLVPVSNPTSLDLPKLEKEGEVIRADNQYCWKQRVVYTGIELNKISSINMTTSTFTADFYLWILYSGSDDTTDITFINASSSVSFDPKSPLESKTIDDLQYRLYHITGDFKANYDLHQYPFDQQRLNIGFQNKLVTNDHLVYVIDSLGLRLRDDNTLDPKVGIAASQPLSSWTYLLTRYASNTFTSHSTLGDPRNFGQRTETNYSGLQVTMTLQRKSLAYLTSHLVPLVLLFILVYASLFLPLKRLGDRLALTVTALLAGAVLLLSVNGELPDIGYVVSLYHIYYAFFFLCLICIIIPMFMEWLDERNPQPEGFDGQSPSVARINIALHITYLSVVAIIIVYIISFL